MRLLLVRHAIAAERAAWALRGRDERERPLTDTGKARFRRIAAGLRREVETLDRIVCSPLRRTRQTAELLSALYGKAPVAAIEELAPGGATAPLAAALGAWLTQEGLLDRPTTVALVGHEPGLSLFGSWLLTGTERPLLELRKGGACLLDLPGSPAPATARLLWLLEPRQARRIAR